MGVLFSSKYTEKTDNSFKSLNLKQITFQSFWKKFKGLFDVEPESR